MIFVVDAMFPPATVELLIDAGHTAHTPKQEGLHHDVDIVAHARAVGAVIVTENHRDFASHDDVVRVFVNKVALPAGGAMAPALATRLTEWADRHPEPAPTYYWL